jgi:N-hydroxyarylamine O-acetyltransferase
MSSPDIDRYLAHIGLDRRPAATLEGLTVLHRAHLRGVTYENLGVQLGRQIDITIGPIFDKIVNRRRGGWCYEMNGLFGWASKKLGFDVQRATGAVMREAGGDAQTANHLVLRVALPEGIYLADVGFGDGPIAPIRVTEGPFTAGGFEFGLDRVDARWWRVRNHKFSGAKSFDFNLDPADEGAFAAKCIQLQTAPDSLFVQNLICFRHREGAVDALVGRAHRVMTPAGIETRILDDAEDLVSTLHNVFKLDVPEAGSLWPKICARHDVVMAQAAAAAAAS